MRVRGHPEPPPISTAELEKERKRLEEALQRRLSPGIRLALHEKPRPIERRRAERFPVDCPAILSYGSGSTSARLRDVCRGGAVLELDRPPPPGTRAVLTLPDLEGDPTLECVVRHCEPRRRHAGVQFVVDGLVGERVAKEILRRFGVAARSRR